MKKLEKTSIEETNQERVQLCDRQVKMDRPGQHVQGFCRYLGIFAKLTLLFCHPHEPGNPTPEFRFSHLFLKLKTLEP